MDRACIDSHHFPPPYKFPERFLEVIHAAGLRANPAGDTPRHNTASKLDKTVRDMLGSPLRNHCRGHEVTVI